MRAIAGEKELIGGQASFITPLKPTVTTGEVSSITSHTASCGGIVTDDGKGAIKAKGVCWNISKNPSVDNGSVCSDDGTGIGVFTSEMTNLASGKTYFVRAYATNNAGTAYGDETSFRTLIKPTVTTSAVSNPSSVTAYCGGNITDDGGYSVTAKGVCWSISKSPGIDTGAICTSDGTGKGSFVSLINGLIPNTLYYVRAYAINSGGTAYGNEKVFKTSFILGDINNDGYITLGDAIIGLKILSRINIGDTVISLSSDINEDQKIGFEEIIYILREISRHNDTLP